MLSFLQSFDKRAAFVGLSGAAIVSLSIVVGSRGLRDYDPALLPYTFGVVFAVFAVAYRYAVWLQRPPTAVYWRRGWQLLFRRGHVLNNLAFLARSVYDNLFAQRFIQRRSSKRWVAHFCFAWGCVLAGAVTFPLVFGWLHFDTRMDDPHWYQVVLFGMVMHEFHTESLMRYVMFNLLNVSAVLVIFGASLALQRRLSNPGSLARQQYGNDIVPLVLLLAISLTGLMLTFSMHWLHGYGYSAMSLIHALIVTTTLLYLPFGKFFHIFQRPAQLSVGFYRRADEASPPHVCRTCGEGFAGSQHVRDLKQVLKEVDLDWQIDEESHYADVCPRCRRRLLGFTQGRVIGRSGSRGDVSEEV
jgi:nitrate reductase gamma subunit